MGISHVHRHQTDYVLVIEHGREKLGDVTNPVWTIEVLVVCGIWDRREQVWLSQYVCVFTACMTSNEASYLLYPLHLGVYVLLFEPSTQYSSSLFFIIIKKKNNKTQQPSLAFSHGRKHTKLNQGDDFFLCNSCNLLIILYVSTAC